MSGSNFPPIQPGPFLDPWLGPPVPRLSRPQMAIPPYTGGGGLVIPPDSPQTFSLQDIAVFNGSKKFNVTTASVKILDAPNTYRNALMIRNCSAAAVDIFIEFGADADTESGIILAQNELIMFDRAVPQDDIYVIGSAAGRVSILVSVISLPV